MPGGLSIFMLGASGTIGRAAAGALAARGHRVVSLSRAPLSPPIAGVQQRIGAVGERRSLAAAGLETERFDAVLSCVASRSGAPGDAWAVDHGVNSALLDVAAERGVPRFVLLSAICVQKPRLAFQQAKLAFEAELAASGVSHAIVRPTAYFKSLSGQLGRVRAGKPYLLFGDGRLTACKPISDRDLGDYLADRVEGSGAGVMPIGGPGPAIAPRDQAEHLFALLGQAPRMRRVPVALIRGIAGGLSLAGGVWPPLATKAALARIAHYYATESMLVWDPVAGRYDAAATPETGSDTLFEHYADLIKRGAAVDLGAHAVF